MWRRLLTVAAMLALLAMSGCINYTEETVLQSNGSGRMKIQYSIEESMFAMMEQGEDQVENPFEFDKEKVKAQFDSKNITVKKIDVFSEQGKRNVVIELAFKDINKLSEAKFFMDRQISFKKDKKGNLVYKMVVAGTADEPEEAENDTAAMMQAMFAGYTFKFTTKMPAKVLEANGKINKNTVIWETPLPTAMKGMTMEAKIKAGPDPVVIIGILLAVLVLAVVFFALSARKPKAPASGEPVAAKEQRAPEVVEEQVKPEVVEEQLVPEEEAPVETLEEDEEPGEPLA